MKPVVRFSINIILVCVLTLGFIELLNVSDRVAGWVNAFSETKAWVQFRTVLHVYGAENEEDLVFVTYAGVSLATSAMIVGVANRLFR